MKQACLPLFLLCSLLATRIALAEHWCPPGRELEAPASDECIDAPPAEVQAHIKKWDATARAEAEKLPIDYLDLVFAYLSNSTRPGTASYCLLMFGDEPPAPLTGRLRAVNVSPRNCPAATPDYRFVYRIRQVDENRYVINFGRHCGMRCAAEWEVTATRNGDGTFSFEPEKTLWIS